MAGSGPESVSSVVWFYSRERPDGRVDFVSWRAAFVKMSSIEWVCSRIGELVANAWDGCCRVVGNQCCRLLELETRVM